MQFTLFWQAFFADMLSVSSHAEHCRKAFPLVVGCLCWIMSLTELSAAALLLVIAQMSQWGAENTQINIRYREYSWKIIKLEISLTRMVVISGWVVFPVLV